MGSQTTTSSCGKRVSKDDTGGVGAAEDSCKDEDSESYDKCVEEQMGVRGDYEKSQGWWMVSPRSGDYEKSHRWWMVKPRHRGRGSTQGVWSTRWGSEGHRGKQSRAGWWGDPPRGGGKCGVQVNSTGTGGVE